MGAKGSKLSKPLSYSDNATRFNRWNEAQGQCSECGYNTIHITIIKNVGKKDRLIPYYDYEAKYFNFKCPKCQHNFHSKVLD